MKKCFLLPLFVTFFLLGKGQSIAINNPTFDVGPYGQGSTIAVPITLSGCFNSGNIFRLYLSDNSGNFVGNGTQIGTFNGFFTTFVNGVIPNGTPTGTGYRLRVVSTNPASILSNISTAFIINASAGALAKVNPTSQDRILSDQLYFGWCSNIQNNTINLTNLCTAGATVTATLKNETSGLTTNPSLNGGGTEFGISVMQNYYTLTVKAESGGNVGTFSYFIINSPNKMALSTFGEQRGCLPNNLEFQFITNSTIGIGDNFPGTQYRVDWGDGSSTFYKHCELIQQNGAISHPYTTTSCTQISGAFSVTATFQNPFYLNSGTQTQQNCDQPQINTKARVFLKPTAKFTFPQYACENKAVLFSNTSLPGQGQNGTNCTSSAKYSWFVDDVLVNTASFDISHSTPLPLNYTFTTTGKHAIKLVVDNSSCDTSIKVDTICIEPTPIPNFTINSGICVPTSFTPINNTNGNPCRPMTFNWSVLDSAGLPTVPSANYTISSFVAAQPLITILKPSKYQIQLCASNACGIVCKNETITVSGKPIVTLPADTAYCGKGQTINFGTNLSHKPTYDNQFGNPLTYTWTVNSGTGGTFSSTTLATQFPQITFNDFGTYTVSVTYSNICGASQTKSQQIIFKAIPVFNAPAANQIVCGGKTTTAVNFTSIPAGASFNWTNSNTSIGIPLSGTGNISSYTTTKPLTQQIATIVITPTINGCAGTNDTFLITVNPTLETPSATISVALCQGVAASALTANAATGDTLKWYDAASVQLSGAPIPNTTATGSTTYFVSQINTTTGCESDKLAIIVNVSASTTIDTASTSNPTICQNANGTIVLKGLLPNTGYILNYNKNGINAGPINIFSTGIGNYTINGLTLGTYDSIRVGANNCASNMLGPIVLTDPNPPAKPVGTSDITICSDSAINLSATSTTLGVTFNWSGPNGYSVANNASPTITNATVTRSGLYIVSTTLNGCSSISDSVNVVVNQTPIAPVVTSPIEYCQFFATPSALTATGTTGNTLNWYTVPNGGIGSTTAPTPATTTVSTTTYYVNQKIIQAVAQVAEHQLW